MLYPRDSHHSRTWEADVILNDGSIATLRAIQDTDKQAIEEFFQRVSERSKYLRFFGAHPTFTEQDWQLLARTRGFDKVTLVVRQRADIVAIAGYEIVESMLPERVGDVSFLVQDSHHGKGVGNILLEHLAQIGREGQVARFFAEMLTQNRTMIQVFKRAGYSVTPELADGFVTVNFDISPSSTSQQVMERRELRAEANSIRRLLHPSRIALLGQPPVPHLKSVPPGIELAFHHTLEDTARDQCDLLVVQHQPERTDYRALMRAAARAGATGVIVMARSQNPGFSAHEAQEVVNAAREFGLRTLGPAALGLINTQAGINATPAPPPRSGSTGLFAQSAGVATLTLSHAIERGCGLSNFIAAGSFADVTGNDVMQFWSTDDSTTVCLLTLDSIGNPRKFFRILRRLALEKQVIVFLPSRALQSARHWTVEGLSAASPRALDTIIEHTGAMVVTRRDAMFDIAQLLVRQPYPRGRRITVISNSAGLTKQLLSAAWRFGLKPVAHTVEGAPVEEIARAADAALRSGLSDAVLCTVVEIGEDIHRLAHERLSHLAATVALEVSRPLIASFVGFNLPNLRTGEGPEELGQLPVFDTYADALEALATIIDNAKRRSLARPTPQDDIGTGDADQAREVIASILSDAPTGRWATDAECEAILAAYDIPIVPWIPTSSLNEACAAGARYGWDVVLKCTSPMVRGRSELPTVLRHIRTPAEMTKAWETLVRLTREMHLGEDPAILEPVVQRTVDSGPTLTMRAREDLVVGPLLSVGVSGVATDLLGDVSWRVPPLRRADVVAMLSELRASALLAGYRGTKPANVRGVEHILMQLASVKDTFASVVDIELTPVIAGLDSTFVAGARLRVAPLDDQRDPLVRRML